jgi:hypothetical protein
MMDPKIGEKVAVYCDGKRFVGKIFEFANGYDENLRKEFLQISVKIDGAKVVTAHSHQVRRIGKRYLPTWWICIFGGSYSQAGQDERGALFSSRAEAETFAEKIGGHDHNPSIPRICRIAPVREIPGPPDSERWELSRKGK